MYGFKIRYSGIPQKLWACETSVNDYDHYNRNDEKTLEIGLIFTKKCSICTADKNYVVGNTPVLTCTPGNFYRHSCCDTGVDIDIFSIAVCFDRLEYEEKEFTDSDFKDSSVLLMPLFADNLSEIEINEMKRFFYSYTNYSKNDSAADDAMRCSVFFQLLAKLDFYVRRSHLISSDKFVTIYIKKAISILENHYAEKISLAKIAHELDITPEYLSGIFKKNTGITFSDYLLQVRMNNAKKLIESTSLPIKKIAESVGIEDESHFRKRFKQYFGINIKEYRCIKNELTLYHEKPIRKTDS